MWRVRGKFKIRQLNPCGTFWRDEFAFHFRAAGVGCTKGGKKNSTCIGRNSVKTRQSNLKVSNKKAIWMVISSPIASQKFTSEKVKAIQRESRNSYIWSQKKNFPVNHMRNNSHIFFINFLTMKAIWILNCKLNSYLEKGEFSSGSAEFRSISFIVFCTFP